MAEHGITDVFKVGIYGLTYKEDVDDARESPTLQMLESMEEHLCGGAVKVYDPWVERDEVPNQVHSMEEFLDGLEIDYSDDLIRSGFRFKNPRAGGSCGCGSSFKA